MPVARRPTHESSCSRPLSCYHRRRPAVLASISWMWVIDPRAPPAMFFLASALAVRHHHYRPAVRFLPSRDGVKSDAPPASSDRPHFSYRRRSTNADNPRILGQRVDGTAG
jgi:hypothetical protein